MRHARILVIGGGIGGLTAAIALRRKGFDVEVIEKDPSWSVYGVGIIQQGNVVRALAGLGLLQQYLDASFGFDFIEIYAPTGKCVARLPSPKLVDSYPANVGVRRKALHKVLGDNAIAAGAKVRLGVTATKLDDDGEGVSVEFSDGSRDRYDLVVGADGVNSATRKTIFPDAPGPDFTGQSVWRYNFPKPPDVDCLRVYDGRTGVGLVPLSNDLMYMYVTTPEPENTRYPLEGIASVMRSKLAGTAPDLQTLGESITDDAAVVHRCLEIVLLEGAWSKGRVVLLGDAVHATTPHLGQGAGMAIEDAIVLAKELEKARDPEAAFEAYRARRFERCAYIVRASRAICDAQLGKLPPPDQARATREMFAVTSAPI